MIARKIMNTEKQKLNTTWVSEYVFSNKIV